MLTLAVPATQGLTTAQISLLVAGIGLVGVVVTAILGAALGRWAEATNRRRSQYADAIATLVAWAEYPYRIRRRTSDDPAELARLADLGHDLQERLRCHHTWIATEKAAAADAYKSVWSRISARTGPAARDAWACAPIVRAANMNLNGWGPQDSTAELDVLQRVIAARFGLSRLMPWLPWRRARTLRQRSSPTNAALPAPTLLKPPTVVGVTPEEA